MQLIAEVYQLLADGLGLPAIAMSRLFEQWNATDVGGYLVEITGRILGRVDEESGRPLLERIRDVARQKGTGQWTSQEALAYQVPTPTLDTAVGLRDLSALPEREELQRALDHSPRPSAGPALPPEALLRALYSGMLLAHAQGFSLLRSASTARGYQLDLEAVARIWRGGVHHPLAAPRADPRRLP
jgi:6-phosphogluconate dehydrogenase